MSVPLIKSGRFHAGEGFRCGENVVVEVAEEVVVGDRCVLPDNAYLGGRSVKIGDDFFGYGWGHPRGFSILDKIREHDNIPTGRWLEVGRGRQDEEEAVLTVGSRCTFHDNRIDLSNRVTVGDDVGLSPEVAIYTHHYWLSALDGWPNRCDPVTIGDGCIVGYRSVILAGAQIGPRTVIGAQSVVSGKVIGGRVYGGNPLRMLKEDVKPYPANIKAMLLRQWVEEWLASLDYRGSKEPAGAVVTVYPVISCRGCDLDVEKLTVTGEEDLVIDDLRWFLFRKGVRCYTRRPFAKLGRQA